MLSDNIVHFARVLRTAGMPIGPDRVLAAMAAIEQVGLNRRDDVHAALSAVMLDRHEQQTLFDAAFEAFWRDPKLLEQLMYLLLPKISGRGEKHNTPRANRLAEALAPPRPKEPPNPAYNTAPEELKFDTTFTFSERERLQHADFESMTAAEFELAKKLAEQLPLPVDPVRRRRHERASHGRLDLRATLQRMRTLDLFKSPGVAETIDWTNALVALNAMRLDPATVHDTLGVLLKHQDDLVRMQGGDTAKLLDELRAKALLD